LALAAVVVGVGSRALSPEAFGSVIALCDLLGRMFLMALQMIIVPLVLASVIVGISSLGDVRHIGGIGLRTIGFYAATTALAVALGVVVVTLFDPGAGMNADLASLQSDDSSQMEN